MKIVDEGGQVDIVYLDFQKAFDKVPHARLMKKVTSYGIVGLVGGWIERWLEHRQQRVVIVVVVVEINVHLTIERTTSGTPPLKQERPKPSHPSSKGRSRENERRSKRCQAIYQRMNRRRREAMEGRSESGKGNEK